MLAVKYEDKAKLRQEAGVNESDVFDISEYITRKLAGALNLLDIGPNILSMGPTLEFPDNTVAFVNIDVEDDGSTDLGRGPAIRITIDEINERIAPLGLRADVKEV